MAGEEDCGLEIIISYLFLLFSTNQIKQATMKTIKILMIFAVLYCNTVLSKESKSSAITKSTPVDGVQKLPFCEAFDLLIKAAPTKFRDYLSADVVTEGDVSQLYSTLIIKEAKSSYISDNPYGTSFDCIFGSYQTDAEASKAIIVLQNEFKKCKPGIEFKLVKDLNTGVDDYVFVEKSSTGAKYYNAFFYKSEVDNKINVVFSMFTNEVCKDYKYLTNEPEQSPFATEIKKVTEFAKTKFASIKGDFVKNGSSFYYTSKYCLNGLTDCRMIPFHKRKIESASDNRAVFLVNVFSTKSKEEFDKKYTDFCNQINVTLGKDYAFTTLKDGSLISYCLKENIGNQDKDLIVIEKYRLLGEYSCVLYIYADE